MKTETADENFEWCTDLKLSPHSDVKKVKQCIVWKMAASKEENPQSIFCRGQLKKSRRNTRRKRLCGLESNERDYRCSCQVPSLLLYHKICPLRRCGDSPTALPNTKGQASNERHIVGVKKLMKHAALWLDFMPVWYAYSLHKEALSRIFKQLWEPLASKPATSNWCCRPKPHSLERKAGKDAPLFWGLFWLATS